MCRIGYGGCGSAIFCQGQLKRLAEVLNGGKPQGIDHVKPNFLRGQFETGADDHDDERLML